MINDKDLHDHGACRIAVFGEALVDLFSSGPVVGGAPFNVARHLAAFGQQPLMLSAIGADDAAAVVRNEFVRYGMRQDGLQTLATVQTGIVDVITDAAGGHVFSIRSACAYDAIGMQAVGVAASAVAPQGWLYFGTLALRAAVSRHTWQALVLAHPGPTYLDLNWRAAEVDRDTVLAALAAATVLKVNEEELAMLLGWTHAGAVSAPSSWEVARDDAVIGQFMASFARMDRLVVTCGAEGYASFDRHGRCDARGSVARAITLIDTVGAGDAFSSVVLAGMLNHWPWQESLARANDFAAAICEVRGAVPATLDAYAGLTAHW
jgi:fructokinase